MGVLTRGLTGESSVSLEDNLVDIG